MRTRKEIFGDEEPFSFLAKCHPINGLAGFRLWYTRVLGLQLKPFHELWVKPIVNREFKRVAIAAPAGSGKSEIFGIGLPSWYMWFNFSKMPSWNGLIVSTSESQSKKILERFKDKIVGNELLRELKGNEREYTWSTSEVKLTNSTSLAVKPLTKNVRSYHPDYIFSDEVSAYDNVPNGRRIYMEYVSSRVGAKDGILAAVSTPDNEEDLLAHLQSLPNYHSITSHALVNAQGEPDINGESIWPDHPTGLYSKQKLMEKRDEIGPRAFALQYMCDTKTPIDDDEAPFPLRLLAHCSSKDLSFEYEPDKLPCQYYIAYDPAFSMEGDYNAIGMAKVKDRKIYLTLLQRYKGDPDEAISVIKGLNKKFAPEKITVDSNAGGSKILRDMTKQDLPVSPFTFASAVRLDAIRETISRLHAGDIILPQDFSDSQTQVMMKNLFHELTNIDKERTPTGLLTYKSHTANDDLAMMFIMLINSIPVLDEGVSYRRRGDRSSRNPRRHHQFFLG